MKHSMIKNTINSFVLDLFLSLYLLGCLAYLSATWMDITWPLWVIVLGGTALGAAGNLTGISIGYHGFLADSKTAEPWYKTFWGWFVALLLIVTFIVGWNIVQVNPVKFFTKFQNAGTIVGGLFSPNFKILTICLTALAETIYLALLATVFAIPFAFIFSFFAARNLMPRTFLGNAVYIVVRTIATVFRSIEAIVWAIIFSVWVGIGPYAGMLALMIHSIAALTKLYSEQIENIDPGPVEAIKATGATTLQTWIYAVIPQILSPYLAFTIYRWDINVRMATIVGFVGGGGIGLLLMQQQQLLRWQNVGLIIWMIALVVWIMDMVSAKVREKLQDM